MKTSGDFAHKFAAFGPTLSKHVLQVSVFVNQTGPLAAGNPCQLHVYEAPPSALDNSKSPVTTCHGWPHETETNTMVVSCYNGLYPIRCCGHGLLAAANWWMQTKAKTAVTLSMHGSYVPARTVDGQVWLTFNRLLTTTCDIPHWIGDLLRDYSAIAAAVAGNDNDYLIIQWPKNYPIERLPRPSTQLASYSQRALIYTAEQDSQSNANIHYRYFAPQYGVEEDTATGSAMRVLADYWSPQFTALTALQCSPARGYLMSRISENHVEVGGYCAESKKGT